MEQISQQLSSMPPQPLLGFEELRKRQLLSLMNKFIRFRIFISLMGLTLLFFIVFYGETALPPWITGLFGIVLIFVMFLDAFRIIRGILPFPQLPLDLGIAVVMQTGIIWLTGALESPLLVIYIPLALFTGIGLGSTPARRYILLSISLCLWLMVIGGICGWYPRTSPHFYHLTPGYAAQTTYVVIKAVVLNMVIVVASQGGTLVYRAIQNMLEQAISARQQVINAQMERNQELVHFSSAIAHELKNPLASIQGLSQLLSQSSKAERQAERLSMLQKETQRMGHILEQFLNFSRPLGEMTVQPVDIREILHEITLLYEGPIEDKKIAIFFPPSYPQGVQGDGRKLKQALVNLLQNALAATPAGGTITWLAELEAENLHLGIHDTGPGVSPELLVKIGTMGFTTKPQGSGIGLTVVRGIAEQHGGRLELSNAARGGFKAVLVIPSRPTDEARTDHG